MSREIYKRSVAPHNFRVGVDGGVPSDNVQAQILLMQDTQPDIDAGLVRGLWSPELFGTKQRASAPYLFATKGYSANSPQRELGDELITNAADREFTSDTGWWLRYTGSEITGGKLAVTAVTGNIVARLSLLTVGKMYEVTETVSDYSSGSPNRSAWISGAPTITANGTYTYRGYALSVNFGLSSSSSATFKLDNVSIREIIPADLTQTTANSQPYDDKIAPSEPRGLKKTNLTDRFMSHSTISFGSNDAWTCEVVAKLNADSTNAYFVSSTNSKIGFAGTSHLFRFSNSAGTIVNGTTTVRPYFGKTAIYHFVAPGNGTILVYVNGVYIETITIVSSMVFGVLFADPLSSAGASGINYEYEVMSGNYTASRIAYRAALLRSIFPEIPTVKVAGLDCAVRALDVVCTPAGNLIANVTDNATWAGLTTAAWAHQSNDLALGTIYGKQYNGYARDTLVTDLASAAFGYHVATEAELTTIGDFGLDIKARLTSYWTTANGTNLTGLTFLGGASRNADGTFATVKNTVSYWCGDSDKVMTFNDDGTYDIDAADKKIGAYILLIKN